MTSAATARNLIGPLLRMGFQVHLTGAHLLPRRGPLLVVSTHSGLLDASLIATNLPRPVEVLVHPGTVSGLTERVPGRIMMDPEDPDAALRVAVERVRGGQAVGAWSGDGREIEAGYVQARTQCPVVPVALFGSHGRRPTDPPPWRGVIDIVIGAPFTPRAPADPATRAGVLQVVEEIRARGGEAVANTDSVSDYAGAGRIVQAALDTFGGLDVVVNNAGILRDRMFVNMSEEEFDSVIAVHLRGTFAVSRHAVDYWRARAKSGETNDARIISTSSPSGIFGNIGQANYGAAKAGIAAMTIILADELGRMGITANAIAPVALTRMTEGLALFADMSEGEADAQGYHPMDPANISPLVVWLGSALSAGVTGRIFTVTGGEIGVAEPWIKGPTATKEGGRWSPEELSAVVPGLVADARGNSDMFGNPRG